MQSFLKYKTSSPAGDLISFMAGVKKMWEETGKKGIIYQRLDMPGAGTETSIHPYKNKFDEPVCMNRYMYEMLYPLIISQSYIEDYLVYEGQKDLDIDFDLIRMERYTNQPRGSLNRWFNYVFPQMASDLSIPWINIAEKKNNKIIINFTQRYRNHLTAYHFLKERQDDIVFIGLENERDLFCSTWNLDIEYFMVHDFYQLAVLVKGCKFFLGNQSFCYQLAEAMKVPRILEISPHLPNVIPIGRNGYDFYHQGGLDYYFKLLDNNAKTSS